MLFDSLCYSDIFQCVIDLFPVDLTLFHKIFRASLHDLFGNLLSVLEAVTLTQTEKHVSHTLLQLGQVTFVEVIGISADLRSSSQGQKLHYYCDMVGDSVCHGRLPVTSLLRILTHRIHRLLQEVLKNQGHVTARVHWVMSKCS